MEIDSNYLTTWLYSLSCDLEDKSQKFGQSNEETHFPKFVNNNSRVSGICDYACDETCDFTIIRFQSLAELQLYHRQNESNESNAGFRIDRRRNQMRFWRWNSSTTTVNEHRLPSSSDLLLLLKIFKYLITRTDLALIGFKSWLSLFRLFSLFMLLCVLRLRKNLLNCRSEIFEDNTNVDCFGYVFCPFLRTQLHKLETILSYNSSMLVASTLIAGLKLLLCANIWFIWGSENNK